MKLKITVADLQMGTSLTLNSSKVCPMMLCADNTLLGFPQIGAQGHQLASTRV